MFKKMKNQKLSPFVVLLISFVPALALAAGQITNPMTGGHFNSIADFLKALISGITYISIPFIVLAFMYSGFLFVSSLGGEGLSKAKNAFWMTVLATFIILGSNVILDLVTTTTNELLG